MIAALKAEFRKLLSVRSTYLIILISMAIVALFAGFGTGYRAEAHHLAASKFLAGQSASAILFVGIILALVGLLLLAHEYRYNTILYTLTSSNSRFKSLLAKFITVSVFAVAVSAFVTFFSPLCTIVGIHLAHKHYVHQVFPVWHLLWQCLFVGWGYAMYALVIIAIIRSQVGAIVTFLLIPLVAENLLTNIFSTAYKYLPFNSLQSVVNSNLTGAQVVSPASTAHSITVTCAYTAVGIVASFVLFIRRDAN